MMMQQRHHFSRGGFTFVEVLAALFFLALVVPAMLGGLTIANRAASMSERRAAAGELAENKLNELLLETADNASSAAATRGDFGADRPGYRWEMSSASWDADATNKMTVLTVEVFFKVQGREYSVQLSSLLNPASGGTQSGSGTLP